MKGISAAYNGEHIAQVVIYPTILPLVFLPNQPEVERNEE